MRDYVSKVRGAFPKFHRERSFGLECDELCASEAWRNELRKSAWDKAMIQGNAPPPKGEAGWDENMTEKNKPPPNVEATRDKMMNESNAPPPNGQSVGMWPISRDADVYKDTGPALNGEVSQDVNMLESIVPPSNSNISLELQMLDRTEGSLNGVIQHLPLKVPMGTVDVNNLLKVHYVAKSTGTRKSQTA